MLRLCASAYWLSLIAWIAALIASAVTAIAAFGTLPRMDIEMPGVTDVYPAGSEEAARFAAGFVAQPVFDGAARVMWISVPVAALTALLLRMRLRWPARSWPDRARVALLAVAVLLALIHLAVLAPRMNNSLEEYRAAVFRGDGIAAAKQKAIFDADHRRADPMLRTTGFLLVGVLALSAYTFTPRRAARGENPFGRS